MTPWLLVALAAAPAPLLKDGDRVVFFGDSITTQHTWTRDVEAYVKLRRPEWSVTFINAGVGGNTAADGLARMDVDVFAHRPTLVLVNFGMNDAGFPPGTDGAAFEKNVTEIFDRLAKAKVRAVWIDTSPFDVDGLGPKHWGRAKQQRIEEEVSFAHKLGADRKLPVVEWQKPLTDAMAAFRAAGHLERLLPDRIHPGPMAHAVMAASVLRALGFDVSASTVHGAWSKGELKLDGAEAAVPWDGQAALTLDLASAAAPVPLVAGAKEANDLGDKDVIALRRLVLRLDGLPGERYRLKLGELDVGRVTRQELARGVDLMGTAKARTPPPADERPPLTECAATAGNPWLNDFDCLWDLLFEKDQLRVLMRHEKVRALPDYVPEYLDKFLSLQAEWVGLVDLEIDGRARAMRAAKHELTITPEAK